jgi:hypothetical protein
MGRKAVSVKGYLTLKEKRRDASSAEDEVGVRFAATMAVLTNIAPCDDRLVLKSERCHG